MSNIACRIFKEQIDLLLSLPDQNEAKEVLYQALTQTCNHFDNQIENQNEIQDENQNDNQDYLYLNHISVLSNNIFKILLKSIKWREFSDNFGGKRENAGRKAKGKDKDNLSIPQVNLKDNSLKDKDKNKDKNNIPTLDDVKSYAQARNRLDLAEKFYDFFNATDWVDSNGKKVKNWKAKFITWESHTEKPREQLPRTYWIE